MERAISSTVFNCLQFFFNDTATTEIYTLSLHDALPICPPPHFATNRLALASSQSQINSKLSDRKSTRLNSSHANISYAVFFLKKNNQHLRKNMHEITPNSSMSLTHRRQRC